MHTPDVSVIMPVYNAYSYPDGWIERAISSVLEYQGCTVELCIGDDASTDRTPALLRRIEALNPGKVKIAYSKTNTGGAGNSNLAAEMATGKYFIMLSCRSWYEPGSLAVMARYLDDHPKTGFVYGNTLFHDGKDSRLKVAPEFTRDVFRKTFASSFGYLWRRQAWDDGSRYNCTVWIPNAKRYMTIADRDMVMSLIFERGYHGKHLDTTTLHYVRGGVWQMNDLLKQHRKLILDEYQKKWSHVLGG